MARHKVTPWEFVAIGVGLALFGLLTRRSVEPFSVLTFILAGGLARLFRNHRYANWLAVGCGLLVALAIKSWIVDFKVVKSEGLTPRIQKNARVFYRPAFFRVRQGDLVLFKRRELTPRTSRHWSGKNHGGRHSL